MPPAPLYLRTLWRYTNAVIIIIITMSFRYELACKGHSTEKAQGYVT